jgi:hypothetical protein
MCVVSSHAIKFVSSHKTHGYSLPPALIYHALQA